MQGLIRELEVYDGMTAKEITFQAGRRETLSTSFPVSDRRSCEERLEPVSVSVYVEETLRHLNADLSIRGGGLGYDPTLVTRRPLLHASAVSMTIGRRRKRLSGIPTAHPEGWGSDCSPAVAEVATNVRRRSASV